MAEAGAHRQVAFRLATPDLAVLLDDGGTVVSVAPTARPDVVWVTHVGDVEAATADGRLTLGPPAVAADVDEVEVERSGSGLRTLVRHSVDATWDVRVVLVNESAVELALTEVRLGWRADPGCVLTALPAGAAAAFAVQPCDGLGPVLAGRLRSGAQPGLDPDGFDLGPVVLLPGHRWSASWRVEVVADARGAADPGLPRTVWLDLDQPVLLPAGPDVAVVAPGLGVEVEQDHVSLAADEPGTREVELRGARGTRTFALTWAPDLDDLVDAATAALSGGPTTPAGTCRLPDAAAGLVVQDTLARRSTDAPDDLADALELIAGALVEQLDLGAARDAARDPLALALLTREADRTDDRAPLEVAATALAAVAVPTDGVGLAGLAIGLSQVRTGGSADALRHLGALAGAAADGLGGLELALLLRPRDAPAGDRVLAGLRRLGVELGAGLPGRVQPAVPLDRVAYASTLLGLVDEGTGQSLRAGWGITAAELARRAAAQARARIDAGRLDDPVVRAALAWLVLGRPPR